MKRLIFLLMLALASVPMLPLQSGAQILRDPESLETVKQCVDNIYNFRFGEARELLQKIKRSWPGHPVGYILSGMITYWENFPLLSSTPAGDSFRDDLNACIRICGDVRNPPDYAEYLLANLGARGLLLMYYADNDLSSEVFPLARSTWRYLRESFNYTSSYDDFYFFTGLYNYYREAYPDKHPVYKVIAILFPKGDREKGLTELRRAAGNSIMLKAESAFFLTHIFINFENNYERGEAPGRFLHETYRGNEQYLAIYVRNLLLLRKYDEAGDLIRIRNGSLANPFVRAEMTIFSGIIQEKKYGNLAEAQRLYNKGIADINPYIVYGDEIASYAYFGLSRIAGMNNDRQGKKLYRKRALELTDYKSVTFD
ncbi:MAG TPA: hypothetical protein PKL65_08365 [Bacteroidales bacterium]|nr:hypothetical protein [Bacteroidales bacterium]HNR42230.1 hypothetical protein [Bacteroidales bacterium]HPM19325.1 hypothetical protein [Bacteroidales bacterium]